MPKSLIKKVIPQFEVLAANDVENHLFYTPIKNFPADFSDADKKQLTDSYTKILTEKLIPSFDELYQFLKGDYLKAGRETSGISAIPYGEAYYDHSIKNYTTTNMTADEIHELGLLYLNYELVLRGNNTIYLGQSLPLDNLNYFLENCKNVCYITSLTVRPYNDKLIPFFDKIDSLLNTSNHQFIAIGRKTISMKNHNFNSNIKLYTTISDLLKEL